MNKLSPDAVPNYEKSVEYSAGNYRECFLGDVSVTCVAWRLLAGELHETVVGLDPAVASCPYSTRV